MKNNEIFSPWLRKKVKNRRRWLALSISCLVHGLIFGLLLLVNPSLRFENLFPGKVRMVRLSPRLNLPSPESIAQLQTRRLDSSQSISPDKVRGKAENLRKGGLLNKGKAPVAVEPGLSSSRLQKLSTSFHLNKPSRSSPRPTNSASAVSFAQAYNFSLIPKNIPEELPWLGKNHYQARSSSRGRRIISKFMISSGPAGVGAASLVEAVTLPETSLPFDPALLSPWANQVVSLIQKKWVELIPQQLTHKRPAHLALEIDREGHLIKLKISQSSGDSVFDESLIKAVQVSQPLPPLPPAFPADHIQLKLVFQANEK